MLSYKSARGDVHGVPSRTANIWRAATCALGEVHSVLIGTGRQIDMTRRTSGELVFDSPRVTRDLSRTLRGMQRVKYSTGTLAEPCVSPSAMHFGSRRVAFQTSWYASSRDHQIDI